MIYKIKGELSRENVISIFAEQYFGGNVCKEEVGGGLLNSANNPCESVVRLSDGKKKCILKMATKNENVVGYLNNIFDIEGYSKNHMTEIADNVLNFFPGVKEAEVYDFFKEKHVKFIPEIYYIGIQEESGQSYIFMEDLSELPRYDAFKNGEKITFKEIEEAEQALAILHTMGHRFVSDERRMIPRLEYTEIEKHKKYLKEIIRICQVRYNACVGNDIFDLLNIYYGQMKQIFSLMEQGDYTLTHNDFNTRNSCFRKGKEGYYLVAYDWDLCRIQNPQFDFIEYILFLPNRLSEAELRDLGTQYLKNAEFMSEKGRKLFWKLVYCNLIWFALYKFCIYGIIHEITAEVIQLLAGNILYYHQLLKKMCV